MPDKGHDIDSISAYVIDVGNNLRIPLIPTLIVFTVFTSAILIFPIVNVAFSYSNTSNFDGKRQLVLKQSQFIDRNHNLNIIGIVEHNGTVPFQVKVGLDITNSTTLSNEKNNPNKIGSTTIVQPLYGRIIYPLGGAAPFKFTLKHGFLNASKAFIVDAKQIPIPYYDVLKLNYSNVASRPTKALVGTAKNTSPFNLYDISVYASAHDSGGIQIDSVRSKTIPILRPGEKADFIAIPDISVKSRVQYYSCAGVDLNSPINTINIGKGKFIAYDLLALAKIINFRYDNRTDSIVFGVQYYNQDGGPLTLKIAQSSIYHNVSIFMDGKPYSISKKQQILYDRDLPTLKRDGKTITMNIFIPKGEHLVQFKGIRT
jgi:hypothetical protein